MSTRSLNISKNKRKNSVLCRENVGGMYVCDDKTPMAVTKKKTLIFEQPTPINHFFNGGDGGGIAQLGGKYKTCLRERGKHPAYYCHRLTTNG